MPHLLEPIAESDAEELISSDAYVAQQKHDGRRLMVVARGATVEGVNRRGLVVSLDPNVANEAAAIDEAAGGGGLILDGELVGDTYFLFDALEIGGRSLVDRPYGDRLGELAGLRPGHAIRLVDTARSEGDKRAMLAELRAANREGIVFKHVGGRYRPGRGSLGSIDCQMKVKFYATASLRVARQNDRRSVGLEALDRGAWVDVGNVTIPPNAAIPSVGSIVEIRYLYAFAGGAVYQPTYLGPRGDIVESECVASQLKLRSEPDEDE